MNHKTGRKSCFRTLFSVLGMLLCVAMITLLPAQKAKAAPKYITKIEFNDFHPQLHDQMIYDYALGELMTSFKFPQDAGYEHDGTSNSRIAYEGSGWGKRLKKGAAIARICVFAKPMGMELENPDYDFDENHLDQVEVWINGVKRTDVKAKNYNEYWRCVDVEIPITIAEYTGTKYTVKFQTKGGSSVADQSVARDYYVMEPEKPTREGKVFTGWYTDQACTESFDFLSTKITKNITLYAGWRDKKVTKIIKKIEFNNFNPELNNKMTEEEARRSLMNTYRHPENASYKSDRDNSRIIQQGQAYGELLKEGEAVFRAGIFALPIGMDLEDPDYDFDKDHLDQIEIWVNGVKRTDLHATNYNESWRSVDVLIPITIQKAKDEIKGTVTITGTGKFGQTLKATVTNSNTTSFTYQWRKDGSDISGATSATYQLGRFDLYKNITCLVKDGSGKYIGSILSNTIERIQKADGPAAPVGLKGVAPSVKGASDGKITGVNNTMEYSTDEGFNQNVIACTSDTITGLKAGTYYVRVKEMATAEAGAKTPVTVNEGPESTSTLVTEKFTDVPSNAWFVKAVQYVYDNGIMSGKGTEFQPNTPVTREELSQMLYNHIGKPAVSASVINPFPDVKVGKWYTNAVLWAKDKQIVSGYGNGRFGIGDAVTREQFAVMLYKYAKLRGYNMTATAKASEGFLDSNKRSDWACTAFDWAISQGIMSGKGTSDAPKSQLRLDPKGKATRAECASMIMKLLQKNGQ